MGLEILLKLYIHLLLQCLTINYGLQQNKYLKISINEHLYVKNKSNNIYSHQFEQPVNSFIIHSRPHRRNQLLRKNIGEIGLIDV